MIIAEIESAHSVHHMLVRQKLSECNSHITLIYHLLYLSVGIKTFLGLAHIIELRVLR